ncbi:MAG: 6-phospho-beta-glucosidase [Bacillota bacterium]|jgi:6-phospho-beta-glucosidase|nr:6-phospho-beta-glucosidase [Bacillota bacterium]HPQ09726.1 6-phospho-beta-glucosidase [Bacillota bacterium]HPZ73281.1 6-phospho-beta-glucosidase [Bacillota bacterium]HQD78121.1 6-phospho-beta-glucosidase [Bacillota bacterium]
MKLCVIGGGSTYTPELLSGLAGKKAEIPVNEVVLLDIDEERLNVVGEFVIRMMKKLAPEIKVSYTLDREEALSGADFVVTQIRVGHQIARHDDTVFCLQNGVIGQETTGAAGFAKAMRTIPVLLDYAKDMERLCPDAWLINFTNPSGIVTEALIRFGWKKTIGLCNAPIGMQKSVAHQFGVDEKDVELDYVGLNHLGWVRNISVKGEDRTKEVLEKLAPYNATNIPELDYDPTFYHALGCYLNGYLKYYYLEEEMLESLKKQTKTRAQVVMEVEEELLAYYRDENNDEKPESLSKRGGAYYSHIALSLISAIYNDKNEVHIVNTLNNGAIKDLSDDASVEIPSVINKTGAHPLTAGHVDLSFRGLLQQVKAYEQLTVEAAVNGSYDRALLALCNHPLVHSAKKAKVLLDFFIERHGLQLK